MITREERGNTTIEEERGKMTTRERRVER